MNSDKQLTKYTNQWFAVLIIACIIGSAFYWYETIRVKAIGQIQFSETLQDFNTITADYLDFIIPNTYYDFVFIVAYTILFYLAYRVFQSSMRIPVSKLGILLCLIPGVLDIIENIIMLNLLNHSDNNYLFNLFWLVVRAKWTLIIPFVMTNFTILIYYLIRFINSFFK